MMELGHNTSLFLRSHPSKIHDVNPVQGSKLSEEPLSQTLSQKCGTQLWGPHDHDLNRSP